MAEQEALQEPGGQWFFRGGNLEWARPSGHAHLAAALTELRRRGYPAEWITPAQARKLVPDLRVPDDVTDIAWYPREGYVLPAALLGRLWGEARDHGAVLRCPEEVVAVTDEGGRARLTSASGESERYDVAVLAAGRWSEGLAGGGPGSPCRWPTRRPPALPPSACSATRRRWPPAWAGCSPLPT
ncbi:NAD(P)/FAD-dependent oxidoreductase [Streptomyces reniochalinae]|uniref:NAD(P)/FAD-dependent oxidoreductase n=1 Tax=Streptomyces reniochalinae TaxID=2250578 RepID=UPI003CCC4D92